MGGTAAGPRHCGGSAPLRGPVEQRAIGRHLSVPIFLDIIDTDRESLCERDLGEPRS